MSEEHEMHLYFEGNFHANLLDLGEFISSFIRGYDSGDVLEVRLNRNIYYIFAHDYFFIDELDREVDMFPGDIGYIEFIAPQDTQTFPLIRIFSFGADYFWYDLLVAIKANFLYIEEPPDLSPVNSSSIFEPSRNSSTLSPSNSEMDPIGISDSSNENKTQKPWELIEDHLWYREAIELLHKGWESKKIAKKIGRFPETIDNRICILRKKYGEDIVPKRRS